MTIKQTWLSAASLLYLYAAIIVFLLGWVKLWIAIPACVLMGYGIWLFIKERGGQTHEAAFPIDSEIKITRPFLAVLVIGTFIMCLLCGYGGFFTQAGDWQKHNAVLSDLTLREWPVYYYNQSGTLC